MLDVHVVISGLEETNVAGFDFTVDYDDTILDFDFYMLGSELGDTDLFEAEDWSMGYLGNGQVHLSELSWLWDLNSQPDSFTLAVISFITENMGMSDLSFSEVILSDEQGEIIYADTVTGSLNATPEPATMLLLAAGLIGVVGLGRKFRKS